MKGRTSFVIAPRLSTIWKEVQVLVINNHRIIKRGAESVTAGAELPRLLDAGGLAQHVALYRHLLDLGDEARALINDLEKEVVA